MADNRLLRIKQAVMTYLLEAKRSITIKKKSFYRELSPLDRDYKTKDCIYLCYGSVAGIGLHIVLLQSIHYFGQMMFFSVLVSVILALMTSMCYAELASLSPSTGSVYHYCYHSIGELFSFLVGWNVCTAYIFSCAYTLRYLGLYIDHSLFKNIITCQIAHLVVYFEPVQFSFYRISNNLSILCLVGAFLLAGFSSLTAKRSKTINNYMVITSLFSTLICFVVYSLVANLRNVSPIQKIETDMYDFFFCVSSHLAYSFSGFEVISCLGEEAVEPNKTIPKSILKAIKLGSFFVVIMTFLHISAWKNLELDLLSPMNYVMTKLGLWPANWVAVLAAMTGMWSSAYANLFLVVHITYSMSRDGLLPKIFSHVNHHTRTLVGPSFIFAFIIGVLGMIFDLKTLGAVSEIGVIFSQIMVAICLLITRFRFEGIEREVKDDIPRWILFNYPKQLDPNGITSFISQMLILNFVLAVLSTVLLIRWFIYVDNSFKLKSVCLIFIILVFIIAICLQRQPQNYRQNLYYQMRGVPTIPLMVILYDIFSITGAGIAPWLSIMSWTLAGIVFYFVYSVNHSVENRNVSRAGTFWNTLGSSINIHTPSIDVTVVSDKLSLDSLKTHKRNEEEDD